jgi:hypothetical protein
VYKDFSDNNTASVSITLTCTSGTVTNNPQLAREGVPAVFTVTGALAGATCTASEPTVPSGYTRNQTDCQNGDSLNGSCTIVNTAVSNPETTILNSNFETGQATGWALNGNTAIHSGNAIGQYSLRHSDKGAASTRSVSTAGYTGVSVTMNVAGESLETGESCVAEISTNGGSTWSSVVTVNDGADTGAFFEATVAPPAASNNANLQLRTRIDSKNKDDHCWSDDIQVLGTASG